MEKQRRAKMWKEKKMKLSNPNFHVSKTRLSVRGIPKTITEKQLRDIFQMAAVIPKEDNPHIKQVKIVRERNLYDENAEPKSKGFGFVEFMSHIHALTALRNTNNVQGIFDFAPERILTVEFALENQQALQKRERRINVQKKRGNYDDRWKTNRSNHTEKFTDNNINKKNQEIRTQKNKIPNKRKQKTLNINQKRNTKRKRNQDDFAPNKKRRRNKEDNPNKKETKKTPKYQKSF